MKVNFSNSWKITGKIRRKIYPLSQLILSSSLTLFRFYQSIPICSGPNCMVHISMTKAQAFTATLVWPSPLLTPTGPFSQALLHPRAQKRHIFSRPHKGTVNLYIQRWNKFVLHYSGYCRCFFLENTMHSYHTTTVIY